MHYKDLGMYKRRRATAAAVLGVWLLAASPIVIIDVGNLQIKPMGPTQVSWQDAKSDCHSLGKDWSLPSIYQLLALYYRHTNLELVDNTDYWSHNAIAGFAFGLNTGRGITSFDRFADTDHFLCIKASGH